MSNIDNLTYGELKQIAAMFNAGAVASKTSSRIECNGRAVIVRARDAGVHYGKLTAYDCRTVWLTDARRLWSWQANSGIALNGVATSGIVASKSKVDAKVASIVILDACEIIDCSVDAIKTIEGA